jgi:hypothetical protein
VFAEAVSVEDTIGVAAGGVGSAVLIAVQAVKRILINKQSRGRIIFIAISPLQAFTMHTPLRILWFPQNLTNSSCHLFKAYTLSQQKALTPSSPTGRGANRPYQKLSIAG